MELKKGQLEMSNMLLQTITSICVQDIGGMKQLPPRLIGKVYSLLSKDQTNSAVFNFIKENTVSVTVFVAVEYNLSIHEKCKTLQSLIKQEIEVITGYLVKEVNVYVDEVWLK